MTTTIQQTAKKFKLLMLLGCLGVVFGLIFMFAGATTFGGILLFASLVSILWGRIGKWWHHE